ncbi:hypothetical protein B4N89_14205 [Embleya scabrispora]|uniref:Uncharacterized protein n=1 Tax=Embleya scabrispora TaxID=159449 RepID=A0A1T3NYL8_9ACTN|nr:hypothetical protein [Embleya scabrispora]OPC81937.1 hypothetical protein B4N89_14205 [Embleya scabrispora]
MISASGSVRREAADASVSSAPGTHHGDGHRTRGGPDPDAPHPPKPLAARDAAWDYLGVVRREGIDHGTQHTRQRLLELGPVVPAVRSRSRA